MKLGVILHGAKNNRHAQRKEIERVFFDWDLDVRVTEYDKHAEKIAKELCNENCDVVLVCGGDGSLNQAANGVFNSNNSQTPLAIWPSGTGNDFVKTLEVPRSFQELREETYQKFDPLFPGQERGKLNQQTFMPLWYAIASDQVGNR